MINSSKFWFIIAVLTIGGGLFDIFFPPRTTTWMLVGMVFIGLGVWYAVRGYRLMRSE